MIHTSGTRASNANTHHEAPRRNHTATGTMIAIIAI